MKKNNIGILVDNFLPSQLTEDISNLDCTFFVRDNLVGSTSNTPVFSLYELSYFNGMLWTFDLNNADYALKCNGMFDVNLYLYDLEWIRRNIDFKLSSTIMRQVNNLFVRSESYVKPVQNYCNRKPSTNESFLRMII